MRKQATTLISEKREIKRVTHEPKWLKKQKNRYKTEQLIQRKVMKAISCCNEVGHFPKRNMLTLESWKSTLDPVHRSRHEFWFIMCGVTRKIKNTGNAKIYILSEACILHVQKQSQTAESTYCILNIPVPSLHLAQLFLLFDLISNLVEYEIYYSIKMNK